MRKSKHFNILISLVLLIFAVISVVNFTYAYFSSAHNVGGTVKFDDLKVQFIYREGEDDVAKDNGGNTINLYSASGPISIGSTFQLTTSVGGDAITYLAIINERIQNQTSCECYIRFWIDAYIVKNNTLDKSINFGKYFVLPEAENVFYTNKLSSAENSHCYYGTIPIAANGELKIGNTLTLVNSQDNELAEIMGNTLQISISCEAVQSENQAYLSVFDDEKGYYTQWM